MKKELIELVKFASEYAGSYCETKRDNAGRLYLTERYSCCVFIREPSRNFPYSESKHSTTVTHHCRMLGIGHLEPAVRTIIKRKKRGESLSSEEIEAAIKKHKKKNDPEILADVNFKYLADEDLKVMLKGVSDFLPANGILNTEYMHPQLTEIYNRLGSGKKTSKKQLTRLIQLDPKIAKQIIPVSRIQRSFKNESDKQLIESLI